METQAEYGKKKRGRKPRDKQISLTLDRELHDFFAAFCAKERTTMAAALRAYVVDLMKRNDLPPF